MKKYILILLLTVAGYGQTLQNPTFGTVTTKTNTESATANRISAQETDGKINWLQPVNIPIPIVPTNYMPTATTLGGHLTGIDNKLGTVVATTAGITTRVWFTADVSVVSATNYYATNATSKGTLASAIQNVVNNDNVKTYFAQDLIGTPFVTATLFPPGVYAGNLSASTSPNSAQQRWTVELYKCDNAGTPIASGVTGAPVGSLGVTVITILDSGLLTLVDGSVTNVQVSGNLGGTGLSMAAGERVRYHVSAEKVGTAGANITQSVYYGTSYNSYIDVPVPLNTTAVQNLSGVVGITTTDALNTLNGGLIYKRTISQIRALTGTLPGNNFYTTDLGQEGNWYYDASDTTSADNTGTILVTADGKRIKRVYSGAVNVSWYGIFANSVSDFTSAVVTVLGLHNEIFFPEGNYNISITSASSFSNKVIRGVKPSWNGSAISGGTKITGIFNIVGSDNLISNLGFYNTTTNGVTISTNASRNIIEYCIFNVQNHGVVMEQFGGTATDNTVRFCDSYGGIHGFVSKTKNATFLKCRSFSASQDGFAMVSDNITGLAFPSFCLNNKLIECEAYNTNTGIAIYSRDYTSTTNTAGILLRNLTILGGNIDTCSAYGINLGDSVGSAPGGQTYNDVENVSISGGLSIQNTVTSNIQLGRSNGVYIGGNNFKGLVNRAQPLFCKNLVLAQNNNNNFSQGNSVYNTINTVNSTNIDASTINEYVETNNTSGTVMSTITNGKVGQVIKLLINDTFTVIPKSSVFRLSKTYIRGKGSFVLLKYANDGSGWDEMYSQCVDNLQSFSYSATLDIDYKFANNAEVLLTGNVTTLNFSNVIKGNIIKLVLQSNTGTRTLSGWDSRIIWLNGVAPSFVDASSRLSMEFYYNGANLINTYRTDTNTNLLTGYVSGAGTVSSTDTVLQAIQKLNGNQLASAVTSGTYTPTAVAGTNVTSVASPTAHTYTKVGNIVTVYGYTVPTLTTGSVNSEYTITLPLARATGATLVVGFGSTNLAPSNVLIPVSVNSESTTTAIIRLTTTTTGGASCRYSFQYDVTL